MAESENPPSPSSDRRQWQRIFNSLVEIVQSQQSQIETLEDDRKFLEDCLCIQQRVWESRTTLLESQISQMKKAEEMGRRVFASKSNLMECMKEGEALLYKKQLEIAESDLEAFRACTESVSAKVSEEKEILKCGEADKGKIKIQGLERCSGVLQKRPVSPLETPRLFSAKLKVPKVKSLPPATAKRVN